MVDAIEPCLLDLTRELGVVANILRKRGCTTEDGAPVATVEHGAVLCSPAGRFVYVAVVERVGDLKALVDLAREADTDYVLAVLARRAAPGAAVKSKEQIARRKLEVWTLSELLFDISEHCLQPAEVYEYRGNMRGVPPRALPEMSAADPLARYYRLPPDSVAVLVSRAGKPELMHVKRG